VSEEPQESVSRGFDQHLEDLQTVVDYVREMSRPGINVTVTATSTSRPGGVDGHHGDEVVDGAVTCIGPIYRLDKLRPGAGPRLGLPGLLPHPRPLHLPARQRLAPDV
jgi:hypothetical protein